MREFGPGSSVLLGLALASCGSANDEAGTAAAQEGNGAAATSAAATQTDPCSLVTAAEVGEIIGGQIVASKPGEGSCTYDTEDAGASSVTIEVDQTDAADAMDTARRAAGALKSMGAQAAANGPVGQDVNAMLSDSGEAPSVATRPSSAPIRS
jgi:hypothetical protein